MQVVLYVLDWKVFDFRVNLYPIKDKAERRFGSPSFAEAMEDSEARVGPDALR